MSPVKFFLIALFNLPLIAVAALDYRTPKIHADAYALYDVESQSIIAQKNLEKTFEPASITKILLTYIIFDEIKNGFYSLSDKTKISLKSYSAEGSRTFLELGSEVDIETLLRGVIVQSGNDASIALAEFSAGSEAGFADKMNLYAQRLGLKHSHFMNGTGLPAENHYSSAADLIVLAHRLISDFPEFYLMFSERSMTYNGIKQNNRNRLLWRDPSIDGIKTGHTKRSGFSLLSSAQKENRRLISVILGAKNKTSRYLEMQRLLNYGFRFFTNVKIADSNVELTQQRVWGGSEKWLSAGLSQDLVLSVPRGKQDQLMVTHTLDSEILLPIKAGQAVGFIQVTLEGTKMASMPLRALNSIEEGNPFTKLFDLILKFFDWALKLFK